MTLEEFETRVNTWLEARRADGWLRQSPLRTYLFDQWDQTSRMFDVDSAAATGALLGLVREAWGYPHLHVEWFDVRWAVCAEGDFMLETGGHRIVNERAYGNTEQEALLVALEAAPVKATPP